MTNRKFKCIKTYTFPSFPDDHCIEIGEVLLFEGYLMGKTPVIRLDPIKHPPKYNHLDYCSCIIEQSELKEHFEELA